MSISSENLEIARKAIEDAGYTPHTIGRYQLMTLLGLSESAARRYLIALRSANPDGSKVRPVSEAKVKIVQEELNVLEEHRLRVENRELRKQLQEAIDGRVRNEAYEDFIGKIASRKPEVPEWVRRPRSKHSRQAMPVSFFSDAHFDEVIEPAQVNWVNGYNREIAVRRLELFFQNTVILAKEVLHGFHFEGITLPFGGDIFSGNIHDELKQTNESTMMESMLHWLGPVEAGIKMLADEFGKVFVPAIVGNHARNTLKPIHKMRVRDNFDWLFAKLLQRDFAHDKRVSFLISEAPDCMFNVFNTRFLLTHGDQFRGGSGISGLLSPMMIGDARKRKRQQAVNKPYDYLVMGHWHQLTHARNVIINGSLKGYDEYAFNSNLDFEKPRQAFWLVDPEHGLTLFAPIHVQGKEEPWMSGGR